MDKKNASEMAFWRNGDNYATFIRRLQGFPPAASGQGISDNLLKEDPL